MVQLLPEDGKKHRNRSREMSGNEIMIVLQRLRSVYQTNRVFDDIVKASKSTMAK
ncbi:MAG: hypothetical protein FWF53_08065 [Candidatus Azobacteroides sp.]|nr:hypothetical protein [Candidatus Azobacteroides sp.]